MPTSSVTAVGDFQAFEQELQKMGIAAQQAMPSMQQINAEFLKLQQQLKVAVTAFSNFTQQIVNIAKAGFAGTQEGNRLSFAWMMLSKQIASLFIPVINTLTMVIQRLTSFFGGLTGQGQGMFAAWAEISAVIAGLLIRLPIMAGIWKAIQAIMSPWTMGLALLFEAFSEFMTGTEEGKAIMGLLSEAFEGLKVIMGAVGSALKWVVDIVVMAFQAVVRGFAWLGIKIMEIIEEILDWIPGMGDVVESIKKFRKETQASLDAVNNNGWGVKEKDKPQHQNVNMAGGVFEGLGASFQRVTEAANKMAGGPEEARHKEQLAVQMEIAAGVKGVQEAVRQQNPALGR